MDKTVIIINGKGGAGKDTICDIVSKHINAISVSSITPIKEIAKQYGWNGEKDNKSRRFLADLKKAFSEYNDLPTTYLLEQYTEFINDAKTEIMFVHIREADEILHFIDKLPTSVLTLYIDRPGLGKYDNESDDNADKFNYDLKYVNDKPLEMLEDDFMRFFAKALQ